MAEEKQEKKKTNRIKQVLKLFGLILLSFLTILAIVFQAPWKVTALLVIILAACIILPKPYLKWFWLSAGVVVIALIIWVFLPDDNGDWKPYKYNFDKEMAALEAKYAIPDKENAAIIYNQLLEDYDEKASYNSLPLEDQEKLPMREPWLSKDYPKIAEWVKAHQNIIDGLIKASEIKSCWFSVSDPNHFEKQMSRNAAMRRWAFLLVSAASNDIGEGRIKEGVQKNLALLKMGEHLCQQPSTIYWLSGTAIKALAIIQFKTFIVTGDATEEYLSFIEQALISVGHNWSDDLPRILEDGKLSAKTDLARFYEINQKGKVRLSRDPWAKWRAYWKEQFENNEVDPQTKKALESLVYLAYWQRKLLKAQTILLWFYLPSSPQKLDEILDTIYQGYYEMAKPDFDWGKKPQELSASRFKFRLNRYRTIELLAGVSKKQYYRIHEIHFRFASDLQGTRIMIALRRYKNQNGRWPESLDELKSLTDPNVFIDPMNGGDFVYKLAEENFTLYSKGKNNIDEDGKRDTSGEDRGADDWLMWPK